MPRVSQPGPDEARRAAASLLAKYDRIAALREAYDRSGGVVDRAAVAALAGQWPGAVRELDTLCPHELSARREALREAVHAGGEVPSWAVRIEASHRVMAAALWVKGRVRRDDAPDPARDADLAAEAEARAGMPLGEGFVAAVRWPPGGRLGAVVRGLLEALHGAPEGVTKPRPARDA